ncbi:MAG: ATP-binding protein [Candidatus Sumerlaeia bacterium]|nr:ATP-binding protein [Candidatus Sumerlaeia bacterium]
MTTPPPSATPSAHCDAATLFRLVAKLVAGADSLQGVLDATVAMIREVLSVDRCSIMLFDETRNALALAAAWGLPEGVADQPPPAADDTVAGEVFRSGEPRIGAARNVDSTRYSTQTYICCPIRYEGRRLGVISVTNRRERPPLNAADLALLQSVADVLAVSIDRAHISYELQRANRQIEHTLNQLPLGILILDDDSRLLHANAPALHLLELLNAEPGLPLSDLKPGEMARHLGKLADRAAQSGCRVATTLKSELDTAADDERPVRQIRITAEFIGMGVGLLFTVEDLTVTHEMAELRRIDQMKSHFISVVSHELRTPITSLRGASTLLTQQYAKGLDETQASLLRIVSSSAERLSNLVNMIIDISMIENEQIALSPVRAQLGEVMHEVARLRERDIAQKGLVLRETYCPDCPPVLIDEGRMTQALAAVFDNAIKYATQRTEVSIRIWHDAEGSVRLSIRNEGDVIPLEQRERVFERFSQLEDPLTRRQGGAGLGLYFARRVTMLHGGVLQFLDDPKGTCLEFVLPEASPED